MRIVILYTPAADDAPPEDLDGIVQMRSVSHAIQALGHVAESVPCELDLNLTRHRLEQVAPDCVFNLVESIAGEDRLLILSPALLSAMGLPYTGAPLDAMCVTTNKLLAKKFLHAHGLPTPRWTPAWGESPYPLLDGESAIVKAAWEHGSVGLDDTSIIRAQSTEQIRERVQSETKASRRECYAEQYIDGREFNLSLLAGPSGPEVCPPAEIVFEGFAPGKPHIVGYNAKWEQRSFEYNNTPRTFDFSATDKGLLAELKQLAIRCWTVCGLHGYARVDFRVDQAGHPWILEVNANPCLSPDAGFAAALRQATISYEDAIARIVADAAVRR